MRWLYRYHQPSGAKALLDEIVVIEAGLTLLVDVVDVPKATKARKCP